MSQRSNSLPSLPFLPASPSPLPAASELLPLSSDDTSVALLSSSPSASSLPSSQQQRQLARNALLLVSSKASHLISSTRASNSVVRFSLDTVSRLVPGSARDFTARRWSAYGEPMLRRIDERLDEAVTAIASATSGLQQVYGAGMQQSEHDAAAAAAQRLRLVPLVSSSSAVFDAAAALPPSASASSVSEGALISLPPSSLSGGSSLSALYWDRLKSKFVSSRWYAAVDSILMQNSILLAFTHHLLHPAEAFFNTVTEEFLSHQSQDEFLSALEARVGPAWDERLAPLARGFYTTARAVSAVVGAGKFVGGVMQLGKMRVDGVMEDLLKQWDRVLGLGDDIMDRWLPEKEEADMDRKQIESGQREDEADDNMQLQQQHQGAELRREQEEMKLDAAGSGQWHRAETVDSGFDSDHPSSPSLSELESSPDGSPLQPPALSDSIFRPVTGATAVTGLRLRSNKKRSSEQLDRYADVFGEEAAVSEAPAAAAAASAVGGAVLSSSLLAVSPLSASHPDRTGQVLMTKFGKRLRQRMPAIPAMSSLSLSSSSSLLSSFTSDLKQRLMDSSWFTLVDEILMQNALVQALAAFVRPAEHFFNTSLQLFTTHNQERVGEIRRLEAAAAIEDEDEQQTQRKEAGAARMEEEEDDDADAEEEDDEDAAEDEDEDDGDDDPQYEMPAAERAATELLEEKMQLLSSDSDSSLSTDFNSRQLPPPHPVALLSFPSLTTVPTSTVTAVSASSLFSASSPILSAAPATASPSTASSSAGSASSSLLLPRIIPPSPSSFLSVSTLSPSLSPSSDPVIDDFVFHLRERLGGSWDDRLYQPARSFYQAAQSTWQPVRPKSSA